VRLPNYPKAPHRRFSLGELDEFGTIEKGRHADLVLDEENNLERTVSMKKAIMLPLILMLSLSIACSVAGLDFIDSERISGSGDLVELHQDFTDFDSLDIGSAFDVEVNQGSSYSVVIRIDDNLEDYLDVEQRGGEVRIGLDPNNNYAYDTITIEVEITMPELMAIDISGASRAVLSGFSSNSDVQVDVSGASRLRGDIAAGSVRMDVSGAGNVELSGSGSDLDIEASGGSSIDLTDFPVGDTSVNASGASLVAVNTNGTLNVDASGASRVEYLGDPTLGSIELSGASTIDER
jgi:hypothetical protein